MPLNPADTIRASGDVDVLDGFALAANSPLPAVNISMAPSNLNAKLAAIVVVNLRPSYQLDECWQVFGIVDNLFDNRDALYGTYFDPSDTAGLLTPVLSDPRTLTLRQQITFEPGIGFKS